MIESRRIPFIPELMLDALQKNDSDSDGCTGDPVGDAVVGRYGWDVIGYLNYNYPTAIAAGGFVFDDVTRAFPISV